MYWCLWFILCVLINISNGFNYALFLALRICVVVLCNHAAMILLVIVMHLFWIALSPRTYILFNFFHLIAAVILVKNLIYTLQNLICSLIIVLECFRALWKQHKWAGLTIIYTQFYILTNNTHILGTHPWNWKSSSPNGEATSGDRFSLSRVFSLIC